MNDDENERRFSKKESAFEIDPHAQEPGDADRPQGRPERRTPLAVAEAHLLLDAVADDLRVKPDARVI